MGLMFADRLLPKLGEVFQRTLSFLSRHDSSSHAPQAIADLVGERVDVAAAEEYLSPMDRAIRDMKAIDCIDSGPGRETRRLDEVLINAVRDFLDYEEKELINFIGEAKLDFDVKKLSVGDLFTYLDIRRADFDPEGMIRFAKIAVHRDPEIFMSFNEKEKEAFSRLDQDYVAEAAALASIPTGCRR